MGNSNILPYAKPRDSKSSTIPINRNATASAQSAPTESKGHLSGHTKDVPDIANTTNGPRPGVPIRHNSVQTRYMDMLLAMDTIPRLHNILSSFFTWILLAGFIIFPASFTTISNLDNNAQIQDNQTASTILASVKNIPLLVIAGVCAGIGAVGMVWLWWRWRQNYVWLLNKIFLCATSPSPLLTRNRTDEISSQTRLPELFRRPHFHADQRLHPTKRHLVRQR